MFARMMVRLPVRADTPKKIMIDATLLKAHRPAPSLRVKKGRAVALSGAQRVE
jgi:hypothetical protein